MWLHYLLFMVIVVFCVLQKMLVPYSNKKRILFFGVFLLFFIFIAFRAYDVGNDTQEYYRLFKLVKNQSSISYVASITRYEIGYIALNYLVGKVTNNFTVLLIIITVFYLYSSFKLIRRYAKSPELSIILMFTLSLFYLAMNIERQCIAMAIFYFAIPFLEKKRHIIYCLLVVMASLFHSTAIILLILMFLPKIDFTNKKAMFKWETISLVGLVFLNLGVTKILAFFPYFQHYYVASVYSEGGIRSASILFFAVRFLIVLLVKLVGGFKYQEENSNDNISVFNMLLFFDLVISAASIGFNMFDRLEKYFSLGYIIVVTNAICSLKDNDTLQKNNKVITTVLTVALSFVYVTLTVVFRSSWNGIFPYSFV